MKADFSTSVFCILASTLLGQNVGIGTDTPESKLHVAGDIRADALLLNIDTSDAELFRFESGCSLIEQETKFGLHNSNNTGWQSFTAMSDGEFLTVDISFSQSSLASLIKVYEGEGTGGTELYSGAIMYFQNGWLRIPTMHITIDSGSIYTVWLDNIIYAHIGAGYPGGRYSHDPNWDLRFRIYIADEIPISISGKGPSHLVLSNYSSAIIANGPMTLNGSMKVRSPAENQIISRFSSQGGYAQIIVDNGFQQVDLGTNYAGGYVGSLETAAFQIRTGSVSRIFVQPGSGNVGIGTETPAAKLDVNGDMKLSGHIQNNPFTAPVLESGWVNFGNEFESAGYYRDKEAVVHLRGLIKSGAAPLITTLPVGYRPAASQPFVVVSGEGFARIDITSAGNVMLVGYYNNGYVSLNGISFRVD